MNDFLHELEQITGAYSGSQDTTPPQHAASATALQNPEDPTWFSTAAEAGDYAELNQEIDADRLAAKVYVAVGSGLATLGGHACLSTWALESSQNPGGYLTFSLVIATAVVSAGLSGSRLEGRRLMTSPWFLASAGGAAGIIGGAYATARPWFDDQHLANTGKQRMQSEIAEIEVKPPAPSELSPLGWGVAAVLAMTLLAYITSRR
jgi:hypothetical protein